MDLIKLREDILDDDEKQFFDEIVRCINVESYRAAYVMIWIIACESLKNKLNFMASKDSNAKDALNIIINSNNDQEIIKQCEKIELIDKREYSKLDSIRESRNCYAHPTWESPSKEEVICDLRYVVDVVLSRPPQYLYRYINDFINELSNDPYRLGGNLQLVHNHAKEFIDRINPKTFDFTLNELFKKSNELLLDFDSPKRCTENCLIFTKYLLIRQIKEIDNFDFEYYLNRYISASSILFSNSEIWPFLDEITKYRVFKEYQKFDKNNLLEYDFINCFYSLYSKGFLEDIFKLDFLEFINNVDYANLPNSLDYSLYYNRIVLDLKTYYYYTQNDAIDFLYGLNLNNFNNDELEVLGRNILQAADGGSSKSQEFINKIILKELNVPYNLVKGIFLELFVNEDNKLRLKNFKFKQLIKYSLEYDNSKVLWDNILDSISNSFIKNKNFVLFEEIFEELNSLGNIKNKKELLDLKNILIKTRCNNLRTIFNNDLENLFNLPSFKKIILPLLEKCMSPSEKEDLSNFLINSEDVLLKFLKRISTTKSDENNNLVLFIDFEILDKFISIDKVKIKLESMDLSDSKKNNKLRKRFLSQYSSIN